MRNEKIEGIGTILAGEYDTIEVDGVGRLKGDVTARQLMVEGIFKSKGKLISDEITIDGVARIFRDVKGKKITSDGIVKIRKANLYADEIICQGLITSTGEVSADIINIDGICSISRVYGDTIYIKNDKTQIKIKGDKRFIKYPIHLGRLYLGRRVRENYSIIDQLECTNLEASGLYSKVIRAGNVKLSDACEIHRLYCDGDINMDDTCIIGEIISKGKQVEAMNIVRKNKEKSLVNKNNMERGGYEVMANESVRKILELYKSNNINIDEAEKMLLSTGVSNYVSDISSKVSYDTAWDDDGKLRIVAYIGRKLLKKGDPSSQSIEVKYEGAALDVESYGNLTCGDVNGNANAGGTIHSDVINGSASCGGSMHCGNIGGSANCGGSLTCKEINGPVSSGGGVKIIKP